MYFTNTTVISLQDMNESIYPYWKKTCFCRSSISVENTVVTNTRSVNRQNHSKHWRSCLPTGHEETLLLDLHGLSGYKDIELNQIKLITKLHLNIQIIIELLPRTRNSAYQWKMVLTLTYFIEQYSLAQWGFL